MNSKDSIIPVLRFAIVTNTDTPVYEYDFAPPSGRAVPTDRSPYLQQLVMHGALDSVEDQQWLSKESTASGFLKNVDKFNKMSVTALVTPSSNKLLVLHSEGKPSEDSIKGFLSEVAELYMRVILNPLHDPDEKVVSPAFHQAVVAAARRTSLI